MTVAMKAELQPRDNLISFQAFSLPRIQLMAPTETRTPVASRSVGGGLSFQTNGRTRSDANVLGLNSNSTLAPPILDVFGVDVSILLRH